MGASTLHAARDVAACAQPYIGTHRISVRDTPVTLLRQRLSHRLAHGDMGSQLAIVRMWLRTASARGGCKSCTCNGKAHHPTHEAMSMGCAGGTLDPAGDLLRYAMQSRTMHASLCDRTAMLCCCCSSC